MQVHDKRAKGYVTVSKWFVSTAASKHPGRDAGRRAKREAERKLTHAPVESTRIIVSAVEVMLARMILDVLVGQAGDEVLRAVLVVGSTHREDARKAVQRVAELFGELPKTKED